MEQILTFNLVGKIRREKLHGRDYLVANSTILVSGVLNGSKGPLFYPPDEVSKDPHKWNHIPIILYHPVINSIPVSGRDPTVLERSWMGNVYNASVKGYENKQLPIVQGHDKIEDVVKLQVQLWFEEEATLRVDPRVHYALNSGKQLELSTGLGTDNEPAPLNANYKGTHYSYIARNYRPDHLAILPDQIGACSIKDGCGVLVNSSSASPSFTSLSTTSSLPNITDPSKNGSNSTKSGSGDKVETPQLPLSTNRQWTQEMRDKLPKEDFAGPDESFPIETQEDLQAAIHSIGRTKHNPEMIKSRIRAIAKRKNLKLPDSWTNHTSSTTSNPTMNKAQLVDWIVTNCDCWKQPSDKETLMTFSDEKLTAMKASAEKSTNNQAIATSASTGFEHNGTTFKFDVVNNQWAVVSSVSTTPSITPQNPVQTNTTPTTVVATPTKTQPTVNQMTQTVQPPLTVSQWMSTAPPEVQSAVQNAMVIEQREKETLISRITANVQQGDQKNKLIERLRQLKLAELHDYLILAAVQQGSVNNGVNGSSNNNTVLPGDSPFLPTYNTSQYQVDENDTLVPLVTNWEEEAKLLARAGE